MYYGVDIGGTKIELAVFSPQLRLLDKWRIATQGDDYQSFLTSLALQISEADRRWPAESGIPGTVGIALPGVIRADGTVVSSNVPCLNQRKVAEDLGALLSRPVALGNDCRCFALSEALLGAGKDHARVLGLILGTGLGGGICIEGRLITGATVWPASSAIRAWRPACCCAMACRFMIAAVALKAAPKPMSRAQALVVSTGSLAARVIHTLGWRRCAPVMP